jgi:hypothetical protein
MSKLEIEELKILCATVLSSMYTKEDFLTKKVTAEQIVSQLKIVLDFDEAEENEFILITKQVIYTILIDLPNQTTKKDD